MSPKKRTRKLPPLPKSIVVMGVEYPTEALLDSFVMHDIELEHIAKLYKRSIPSVKQALDVRKKEFLEQRNKALIDCQIQAKAIAGDSKMITLYAVNRLGYDGESSRSSIDLPQPLIINFPKQ